VRASAKKNNDSAIRKGKQKRILLAAQLSKRRKVHGTEPQSDRGTGLLAEIHCLECPAKKKSVRHGCQRIHRVKRRRIFRMVREVLHSEPMTG